MNSVGVILMIGAAFLAAVSQVLLKLSATKKYKHPIWEYANPLVVMGYGILFLTMGINIYAYKFVDYKYGPVLNSTSYIFILLLGAMLLKEKITKKKLLGNLLIIIGIIIYSQG